MHKLKKQKNNKKQEQQIKMNSKHLPQTLNKQILINNINKYYMPEKE